MKEVWDTKREITGESVAKQHRLVVSKMVMCTKWRKTTRQEKRTKWWKLREKKDTKPVQGEGTGERDHGE